MEGMTPSGNTASLQRVHVITAVTHRRKALFRDFQLGRLLVNELRQAQEQELADSLAWVVMPDRLHWLVALHDRSPAQVVQHIKSRSAVALNGVLGSERVVWQSGYHDRPVRDECQLLTLARQIVANPRRAGLVKRARDYPLWDAIWV